jgi:hypothetical protein
MKGFEKTLRKAVPEGEKDRTKVDAAEAVLALPLEEMESRKDEADGEQNLDEARARVK